MANCEDLITTDDLAAAKIYANKITEFVESSNNTMTTPEGEDKLTITGMGDIAKETVSLAVSSAGYTIVGDFSDSSKVTITSDNQVYTSKLVTGSEDALWRTNQVLPYTPTGADPTSGAESGKWVVVAQGELKSIARSLNVLNTQVIYSTDTTTVLDDVLYIYDASEQITYEKPSDVGAGEVIVSVSSGVLTTGVGAYVAYTTAQMELQKNGDIRGWGAVGGNLSKDNAALVSAVAHFKSKGGGTIKCPRLDSPYLAIRNVYEDCNHIYIVGSGEFKVDESQTGSSQIFYIKNSTKFIIGSEIVLNGNRDVVGPTTSFGFHDSPITMEGCKLSGFLGELESSVGVGVNICNGSIKCFVKRARINNTYYAAVQSHVGSIDTLTGDYDDNQPVYGSIVEGNYITECREDVRFSGNRGGVFRGNHCRSTSAIEKVNSVYVYTGTAPNAAGIGGIEQGSKNVLIEHNDIDVVLDPAGTNAAGILILNAKDAASAAAKLVSGTTIRKNDVTTYDTTALNVRGFNIDNGDVVDTTVYDNDFRFNDDNETATAYALTRRVKRIKYEKNRVHGQVRYGWSVNPSGEYINNIQIIDDYVERCTSPIFKSTSSGGGTTDKIQITRLLCDDTCTINGKFGTEAYAIQATSIDGKFTVDDCDLSVVTNTGIQFFRGDTDFDSGNATVINSDLSSYTAATKIQFNNPNPSRLPLVRNNAGYVTEAIGNVTMLTGTNNILVDLSELPGFNYINVSPLESTTGLTWWALKSGQNLQIRTSGNVSVDTDFSYQVSQFRVF